MNCKHDFLISECNPCLSKILKHLVKTTKTTSASSSESCQKKTKCKKCYANSYVRVSNQSLAPVIRTFTSDELETECGTIVNLTSSCSNGLLEIGKCKSPENKWCKIIDRENLFVTSLQVPKGCGGCYSYDISASVALVSTLDLLLDIDLAVLSTSTQVPIPAIVDLRLSEQLPREVCVADEVSDTPTACFTEVTFPIIDTTTATTTLGGLDLNILTILFLTLSVAIFLFGSITGPFSFANALFNQNFKFSNLNITGTVCLKECQRLVPTLTIRKTQIAGALLSITDITPNVTISSSNIKLYLSGLSLKLVKLDSCKESCQCKNKV